jgi:hypothetical protein
MMQKKHMKTKRPVEFMTMDELIAKRLPELIQPVPSKKTLGRWFRQARIPRIKANPEAPHGGGRRYFLVGAVEKFFFLRAVARPQTAGPSRKWKYRTATLRAKKSPGPSN